jgi:hypothetical protein
VTDCTLLLLFQHTTGWTISRFIDTPNCVLEDRVQYSTVHIPNVFCVSHWNCLKYLCVHRDFWSSHTMGTGSFPGVQLSGMALTTHPIARRLKKGYRYICTPLSGNLWTVIGWHSPLLHRATNVKTNKKWISCFNLRKEYCKPKENQMGNVV